ncbi:hypothetical protein [Pseudomonas sp. ES3-33]|uniref:hypothetical protein n=1 Tax=Pseudomonas sp. ES3-33 TaxID=1628833 RepID=UPI00128DDA78|nr:hypothetical protein [Pseudomonas sp. ES3-33]
MPPSFDRETQACVITLNTQQQLSPHRQIIRCMSGAPIISGVPLQDIPGIIERLPGFTDGRGNARLDLDFHNVKANPA